MKIILKEDIVNLGFKNDVVEVKNGYSCREPASAGSQAGKGESRCRRGCQGI